MKLYERVNEAPAPLESNGDLVVKVISGVLSQILWVAGKTLIVLTVLDIYGVV